MNLDFLDKAWQSLGNIGADTDKFMKREMPFDSGWGAPAAAVAAYFGGPMALEAMGETGGAASGSGGFMNSLGSMFGGGETGGFGIGQGSNYANFANTSGGAFGGLNPSSMAGEFGGLNAASPSGIASSNSAMGLSDLSAPSSMSSFGQSLAKQLLSQKQGQQTPQNAYQYHEQPVQRQAAFAPTPATFQVQDKPTDIAALVAALRSKGTM